MSISAAKIANLLETLILFLRVKRNIFFSRFAYVLNLSDSDVVKYNTITVKCNTLEKKFSKKTAWFVKKISLFNNNN